MVLGLFTRRSDDNSASAAYAKPYGDIDTLTASDLSSPKSEASPVSDRPPYNVPYMVDYVQAVSVSEGRHGKEMGEGATLLTTVMGSVVRSPVQPFSSAKGGLLSQRFPEMVPQTSRDSGYLVFSLTCGSIEISTLHKFNDINAMHSLLRRAGPQPNTSDLVQLLDDNLAFILQPAGAALKHLPVKGPKDAEAIRKAFGEAACSMRRYTHPVTGAQVIDLCIDLFSMWIVKHLFPKLAFVKGRQTDIFITDFNSRECLCAFRLEATDALIAIASASAT
ncbi:hypothetical protein FOL47_009465 [Perkinsus chesapeaki]|uniref:Uncharacterized protein n=1 Tax=Perkinsus chesapeaki TaxID=330153 RepID=A0A7J6L860_PERCH|nr:hypothetical protein FOL47_009465 [Perkinsus chesapeaki]